MANGLMEKEIHMKELGKIVYSMEKVLLLNKT